MESIFDHDVNEHELNSLLIKQNRRDYLKSTTQFKRYSDIYHLFKIRGDENKANEVYKRFSNE
ncbi:MAG: hypothetical protein R6W90_00010 [Ignavibacteriaceae bacterium]